LCFVSDCINYLKIFNSNSKFLGLINSVSVSRAGKKVFDSKIISSLEEIIKDLAQKYKRGGEGLATRTNSNPFITTRKRSYLLAHFNAADLTMLSD
jgi:hypothetical protein